MDPLDTKKRIFAAHKLLTEKTTSRQKFESVRTLIKGLNLKVDKMLDEISKSLTKLEKLHKGEYIELTAEHLPEDTEERKKRKKYLLLFIRNWKGLKSEVERVKKEFEKGSQGTERKIQSGGKIVAFAKGPLGLITAIAVVAVIGFSVIGRNNTDSNKKTSAPTEILPASEETNLSKQKIKVIIFDGKQIPLSELMIGQGADCLGGNGQAEHYHPANHVSAKTLDGIEIADPNPTGCGFGKVSETEILEVE